MRTENDNAALWGGLEDGSLQVVATDHCSFFYNGSLHIEYEGEEIAIPGKELGVADFTKIPNGLPAVGDRLPILWTYGVGKGHINANEFVALTSTNAAKIFGLYPRKGNLQVGADADILVWDPDRKLTYGISHAHHRTDYNLWEGFELQGFPEKVFLRGQLIVDGEHWYGNRGMGCFLKRAPFAEVI
jgi:dihydropyrimidinase